MITSPTMRWVLLALAGLLVAVAVAVLAGKLTSQRIGLASEPLRAGEALAPTTTGTGSRGTSGKRGGPSTTSTDRTSTATTTPTTATTTSTTPTTTTTPDDSQSGDELDGEGSSGDD